jgi:hypothetical protein
MRTHLLDRFIEGPEPLTPSDGQALTGRRDEQGKFHRSTDFSCQPVKGATGYSFEVIIKSLTQAIVKSSPTPSVTLNLVGAQKYTWRCWALFHDTTGAGDRCSKPSREMRLSYAD